MGGPSEQHATLSFRQIDQCEGGDIEIKSLNIANGGSFGINLIFILPVGDYTVVASTYGKVTQEIPITVELSTDTKKDITF